ncbi:glycosyltransferase family 22 protein [Rhodotorula graminis WP1]|uniref:Mannosyltransferase n=1 Tax=Rhodotorula graminis (strain WP1) TaxID=578459 RepID=A0A194S0M4_RHOGW|nr:glycosyltransferase family 22 protein [Rhodotorula graminis WP1]KPV74278.1 glycosyltransferase family 22 protein [Rhodotorula graminis WP1]
MLSRRRAAAAYTALAVLRVLVAFTSLSSIHPDEHFQNPEIAAAFSFDYAMSGGDRPLRTWEWRGASPCRSILPVAGSTGLAFLLVKVFLGSSPPASALFAAERAVILLFSFGIDYVVWHISRRSHLSVLLFASSPVTFTFLLRPFSNTLETVFLALAFFIFFRTLTSGRAASVARLFGLGVVLAVGIFNRITFAAFAMPLVLSTADAGSRQTSSHVSLSASSRRLVLVGTSALAGFIVAATSCIVVDTAYFSTGKVSIRTALNALAHPHSFIVTPLNLLRYNASSDNLAEHGLHPRWLHAVVNAPSLFGAGLVIVALSAADLLRPRGRLKPFDRRHLFLYLSTFFVPLVALSVLPHQEPRFLVPLVLPVVLLAPYTSIFRSATSRAGKTRRVIWVLWLAHSFGFTIMFGYLHQGGLVPATLALNGELRNSTTRIGAARAVDVVFWRTFMPPRHLLLPLAPGALVPAVRVTDLAGASSSTFLSTLAAFDLAASHVIVVAPAYTIEAQNLTCLATSTSTASSGRSDPFDTLPKRRLSPLVAGRTSYGVHVDMDRLGDLSGARWKTLGVGVWTVE